MFTCFLKFETYRWEDTQEVVIAAVVVTEVEIVPDAIAIVTGRCVA